MRRLRLFAFLGAVSIPAAFLIPTGLWAGSPVATPSHQYASQIVSEASRVESDADGLQGYVRSGASDRSSVSIYVQDMDHRLRKISSLVDKVVSEPGVSGDARAQAEKMKLQAAGLRAMVAGSATELSPNTLPANAEAVFADTTNIVNRSNSLRASAESFSSSN
jgi:hypothetical protein